MTSIKDWNAGALDRYKRGNHDSDCEQRVRYGLCGCRKRERLARGLTVAPTLTFQYPTCDGCYAEVEHDGDSWVCHTCHVAWDTNGYEERGTFDDESGDLSASTAENYGERMIVLASREQDAS